MLRRGIAGLLDGPHEVVASCGDLLSLIALVAEHQLDVVIVGECADFDVATLMEGLELYDHHPAAVVLVDTPDPQLLAALLRAGVRGVISRRVDDGDLLDAVARVAIGERVIDQAFLPMLFEGEAEPVPGNDLLTPREADVLRLLASGKTNRMIAEALFVGEATVKTHLAHIYAKLNVADRHRAVGRALEVGLLR